MSKRRRSTREIRKNKDAAVREIHHPSSLGLLICGQAFAIVDPSTNPLLQTRKFQCFLFCFFVFKKVDSKDTPTPPQTIHTPEKKNMLFK
jgi:hypothetical protein